MAHLCSSCRFSTPTQVDPILFPSQLYVGRKHLHCSIKNLTQGFLYATGDHELLVVLFAHMFDWVFVTGSLPPVTAPHGFQQMSLDLAHPTL